MGGKPKEKVRDEPQSRRPSIRELGLPNQRVKRRPGGEGPQGGWKDGSEKRDTPSKRDTSLYS